MNLRLWKAVIATQPISLLYSILKAEATIQLVRLIADPVWLRAAVYGLGIVLTLAFAPVSAWLAYRIQAVGLRNVFKRTA